MSTYSSLVRPQTPPVTSFSLHLERSLKRFPFEPLALYWCSVLRNPSLIVSLNRFLFTYGLTKNGLNSLRVEVSHDGTATSHEEREGLLLHFYLINDLIRVVLI